MLGTAATVIPQIGSTATAAEGPIVFELPEATFVVPPGWAAKVDETGAIVAEAAA